jgi:hypothetical protein
MAIQAEADSHLHPCSHLFLQQLLLLELLLNRGDDGLSVVSRNGSLVIMVK